MYVNQHLRRQYAFLRASKKELLLVVANFDDVPVTTQVCIPAHAFDYLNLKEGSFEATDLLTGATTPVDLYRDAAVSLSLAPRQSVVLKLK